MTETTQQQERASVRTVLDVVAVLCLIAAVVLVNVVAWSSGLRPGLLAVAGDLTLAGVVLGTAR